MKQFLVNSECVALMFAARKKNNLQGLAAYKSFEEYRLFDEGYVESLLRTTLAHEGMHLFVGKVRPAMKDKRTLARNFTIFGFCWKAEESMGVAF